MWAYVLISVRAVQLAGCPANKVSICGKNFNVVIFSDTINMINVKLYKLLLLTELCPSYHFQWLWSYFKVTAVSNRFNWKFNILIHFSWNFVQLLIKSSRSWTYYYFLLLNMFKGDNWNISSFEKKNFIVGFFSDTIKARSFKICMFIILFGVYIAIVGLMTLTLFQGHRCVRNLTANCVFWILVLCSLNFVWLLHTLKTLCTVRFMWLWCVFKGDNEHVFHWSSVWACQKL